MLWGMAGLLPWVVVPFRTTGPNRLVNFIYDVPEEFFFVLFMFTFLCSTTSNVLKINNT